MQILVAIPDDWQKEVRVFLEQQGLSVIPASTHADALKIAQSELLRGIITIGEWATENATDRLLGLVENGDSKTPSVMLVSSENFDQFFEWYNAHYSPLEEYCHIPFGLDELWGCMKRVGMIKPPDK